MWAATLDAEAGNIEPPPRHNPLRETASPTVLGADLGAYGTIICARLNVPEADVNHHLTTALIAGLSCPLTCWTMVPSTRRGGAAVLPVLPCRHCWKA